MALGYYDLALHEGIADWAREHDWDLDTSMVRPGYLPVPSHWDGILTLANRPEMIAWLAQFDFPIVHLLTAPTPELRQGVAHFPSVDCNYASIGAVGARHLLTLGKPTFVFYQRTYGEAQVIRDSFVEVMRAAGEDPVVFDFHADHPEIGPGQHFTRAGRLEWLARKIRSIPLPAAIMAEDDRFALDLIAAARQLKLRVPEDIAILGADDQRALLRVSPIGISSVDTNMRRIGYIGAEMLAGLTMGAPSRREPFLVAARRVVARESTATYTGPHRAVNEALRYVRQNFREPLSVESVARHVHLTPRGLQRALRQQADITLNHEITRLRLEAVTHHLEQSDLKLDAIATEVCLGDAKNLCRLFRQRYGTTPHQWRTASHQPG